MHNHKFSLQIIEIIQLHMCEMLQGQHLYTWQPPQKYIIIPSTCLHTYMHACMHTYIHTYIFIYCLNSVPGLGICTLLFFSLTSPTGFVLCYKSIQNIAIKTPLLLENYYYTTLHHTTFFGKVLHAYIMARTKCLQ